MRVWDIHPGYLNRQSLLGEHRELHAIVSIFVNGKKGYSQHPETLRWVGFEWALERRHRQLVVEMELRGFKDKSPVDLKYNEGLWPTVYVDEPFQQFNIIKEKYVNKEPGRIPLPKNAQQLWSHHKYSMLARDANLYKQIGKDVAAMKTSEDYSQLAKVLTECLRVCPTEGGLRNALQHMWGHVSGETTTPEEDVQTWSLSRLMAEVQKHALRLNEPYLLASTALSELKVWLPEA